MLECVTEKSLPRITIKNESESVLISVSRTDDGILALAQDADRGIPCEDKPKLSATGVCHE